MPASATPQMGVIQLINARMRLIADEQQQGHRLERFTKLDKASQVGIYPVKNSFSKTTQRNLLMLGEAISIRDNVTLVIACFAARLLWPIFTPSAVCNSMPF